MKHRVNVPREVYVEEYYVLRGIQNCGLVKKVIQEKEFKTRPSIVDIVQFLEESKADFVSEEMNYRLSNDKPVDDDLPFM